MSYLEVMGDVYKQAGPQVIAHHSADAVVASTLTWTFGNGNFNQTYIGVQVTVTGASNAGNNGTFTIATVPSATTFTTVPRGVLQNETFGGGVSASVAIAPCWWVDSAVSQIQVTFADGTVLQLNSTLAVSTWLELKNLIKQLELRMDKATGGAIGWTFNTFGSAALPVNCSTGQGG